jgi:hypothetical protein
MAKTQKKAPAKAKTAAQVARAAALPDYRSIVEQVYEGGTYNLANLQGCGVYTQACAKAVHAKDPRFKQLGKKAGRTHVLDPKGRRVAGDAILFVEAPGRAIACDIVGSSASPDAKPSWHWDRYGEDGDGHKKGELAYRYTENDAVEPDFDVTDPPAAETHRYDGGGNDTGKCDRCGQPRAAAVHAIPEAGRQHAYDGGEHDTGVCDICGQAGGAAIHGGGPPPVPPPAGRLSYQRWLDASTTIAQKLQEFRGGFGPTDIAHFLYGMVEERRSLEEIVKEISKQ